MKSNSNRAIIKKFIVRYLLFTEGIDYLLVVPAASAYFITKANFPFEKLKVFLIITGIVYAACSVITVLLQRYIHKPFLDYAGCLDRAADIPIDLQIIIRERFVGLFMPHIIEVTFRWMAGFGIIAAVGNAVAGITFNQLVAGWTAVITAAIVSVLLFSFNGLLLLRNLMKSHIFDRTFLAVSKTNKTFFGSARNTIIGTVTLILILLCLLLTAVAITIGNNSLEEVYIKELEKTGRTFETQMDNHLEKQLANAGRLARNRPIIEAVSRGKTGEASSLLREYLAGDDGVSGAFLRHIDPDRAPLAALNNKLFPRTDSPAFRELISDIKSGNDHITEILQSGEDGDSFILVAVPVSPEGFLCLAVEINNAVKKILKQMDRSVTFLLCSFKGDILGQAGDIIKDQTIAGYDWGREILASPGDIKSFEINDIPVLAAGMKNDKYKFITVAMTAKSEYQVHTRKMIYPMIANGLLWMLIIVFLLYRMLKLRLEPIQTYRETLTSLAEGDFTSEIKILAGDEIGMVATAMDIFIEKIKEVINHIAGTSAGLSTSAGSMSGLALQFSDNSQNQAAMSEEINASVEEISAGIEGVAHGADDQYDNIKRLAERIHDLSSQIKRAVEGIDSTKNSVKSITALARDGEDRLKEMNQSMEKITAVSKDVTSIISIISKISDNIDLLSLNAAIEAARAGDAGKGFAVVADEINKLAEQTAQSIHEINAFIMQNNEEVEHGRIIVSDSVSKMRQILAGIEVILGGVNIMAESLNLQVQTNRAVLSEAESVGLRAEEIKNAVTEQRIAIEEVVKSMSQISELSQRGADGSEEIRFASEQLAQMADNLRSIIKFFKT